MNRTAKTDRHWVVAVIISTSIYLILHNYTPSFVQFNQPWWMNLVRMAMFGPLLWYLYRQANWARTSLAVICSLLVLLMIVLTPILYWDLITRPDFLYMGTMLLCMLFNSIVLWFKL